MEDQNEQGKIVIKEGMIERTSKVQETSMKASTTKLI